MCSWGGDGLWGGEQVLANRVVEGAGTKARPGVGVFERQVKWPPPHPPNRKKLSICSEVETCCCDVACSTSTHYTGMILGDGGPQKRRWRRHSHPWPDWGFGARRFTIRGLSERHGFYWELGVLGALSGDQNIKNGLNVK